MRNRRAITPEYKSGVTWIVKQYHDRHDFRLGHGGITVILVLCAGFEGIFSHHCIKKLAELKISEAKSSAIQKNSVMLHSLVDSAGDFLPYFLHRNIYFVTLSVL